MNRRRQCLQRCQDSMPSLQPLYPRQLRCQCRQASKPPLRLRRCQDSMPSLQPLYPRQLRCQCRQTSKPLLRLRRCRDSMPSLQPLHPRQLRCQCRQTSKPTLQRRVRQSTYQDLRLRRISFEWWSFGRSFFEWSSQWTLFFGQQSTLPPYESLSCVQFGASAFPLPPAPPPLILWPTMQRQRHRAIQHQHRHLAIRCQRHQAKRPRPPSFWPQPLCLTLLLLSPYESLSCVRYGASAFPLPPAPPPRAQVFLLLMRQWTIRRNRCHQMKRQ